MWRHIVPGIPTTTAWTSVSQLLPWIDFTWICKFEVSLNLQQRQQIKWYFKNIICTMYIYQLNHVFNKLAIKAVSDFSEGGESRFWINLYGKSDTGTSFKEISCKRIFASDFLQRSILANVHFCKLSFSQISFLQIGNFARIIFTRLNFARIH